MDLEKAKEALAGFAGQAEDLIKTPSSKNSFSSLRQK